MSTGVSLKLGGGIKRPHVAAFGKKPVVNAFAADSDDEAGDTVRRQTSAAEAEGPSQSEVLKVADKLAEFVAKNGRSFEDVTRTRNAADGPFKFLFDKDSADYKYYDSRVEELVRLHSGSSATVPAIPPPPAPRPPAPKAEQPRSTSQAASQRQSHPAGAAGPGIREEAQQQKAKDALAAGDSLAAMEAFAAVARRQEEDRGEREARMDHLNETSFDRRRKVAVYKSDGRRGHHMQDFIPPEELAALLAKSGDSKAAAQAAAIEKASQLGTDNIGHKLLSQMGWKDGEGLGLNAGGISAPVTASGTAAGEKRGLGAKARGDVEEGDDEFDVYRKRMMLGYKHRPNPLGNPRRQYDT